MASYGMTEEERYHFDLYGYLVRRGALTKREVAALQAAVDGLDLLPPGDTIPSQRFDADGHKHLHRAQVFRDLIDHPMVFDVLVELVGPMLRLDHAYGIVMGPGTSGLGLHGGGTPFDPAQYYLVRNGRMFNGLTAVQWSLVDARPGEGGFCCIPGSHRASFGRPSGVDVRHRLVVEVPLGPGDVVVFTEALTHGTLPWMAPHERRTLLYKYSPGHESWASSYLGDDAELVALLSERQRWLVGRPRVAYRKPITR